MSARSKACDIPPKVRRAVYERDSYCCIICGRIGIPNGHYLPRSTGGLGIEENIVTLCVDCHHMYDNGGKRKEYKAKIKAYLMRKYPGWNEGDLKYRRFDYGV